MLTAVAVAVPCGLFVYVLLEADARWARRRERGKNSCTVGRRPVRR